MGFLGGVAENGIAETAKRFRMGDLANLPPDVVLQRLVDVLFPNADTREQALARDCGAKTLQEWLSQFDLSNGDISKIDSTDLNDVPQLIKDYLVNYVSERMDNELLSWAEQSGDIQSAMELSDGMRDYVAGELNNIINHFAVTDNSSSWLESIGEISEKLFLEAFTLIEIPKEEKSGSTKSSINLESNEGGDNDE
jgi:hypothetical protein